MPKTVKYIGTVTRWPELATTGKQSTWVPGQQEQRSDTEAAQLLATGLFSDVDATQLPEQKVVAISGVVSGDGVTYVPTNSRWLGLAPVGPVTRTSLNDGSDSTDLIMASFVVPPASVSGLRIGSMVEVIGLFDVTNSAQTKSLRVNYTAGAVGPVSFSSASPTTSIGNGMRFQVHVKDANTITCLGVATASGAGASAAALVSQNSPNVLDTGFTITLIGRWNSGYVAGSETIILQHAKALFTP